MTTAAALVALVVAPTVWSSSTPAGASPGQVVNSLTAGLTPADLVNNLLGGGVTVSNITYTGSNDAAGNFSGMSAIGFDTGVVLSSGQAASVIGPNDDDGKTTAFGTPGDATLDALVAPNTTNDASVLEFDFVPTAGQLTFDYVFASEEYNEFTNSSFNDVFGFYVNGTNCALVPGTNQPVAINTINGGKPLGTGASNPSLYRNNDLQDGGPTIDTQMDGMTVELSCSATVNPGVSNHMKLAVADTSDEVLDTAVFIKAQSFEVPAPPVCEAQDIAIQAGYSANITLVATDPNPSDTLTFDITSGPSNGSIQLLTAPDLIYTPAAGFIGTDSFVFSASDGALTCEASVTIAVNAPPVPVAVVATPTFTG